MFKDYDDYETRPKICKMLIERGADFNAIAKLIWTPLLYAASYHYEETVKVLLENGANPNLKAKAIVPRPTVKRLFQILGEDRHKRIMKILVEYGAE